MPHHPSQLEPLPPPPAREIFAGLVGRALTESAETGVSGSGLLAVEVVGEGGGVWTVDLRSARVTAAAAAEPDAALRVGAGVFGHLLTGRLDLDKALLSGELLFTGDPAVLTRLAALLAGPRGPADER